MNIRKTRNSDIKKISILHAEHIPSGFLSTLGTSFLCRLYQSLAKFNKGILLVAEHEGEIVGFISGTEETGAFHKFFLKRNCIILPFILFPKLFKIYVIKKILETAKYSNQDLTGPAPCAELLSMVVIDKFQGKGIAKQLFKKLMNEFECKGVNDIKIIAGGTLLKANRFYQKMGCREIDEIEVHTGERSKAYIFTTQASFSQSNHGHHHQPE